MPPRTTTAATPSPKGKKSMIAPPHKKPRILLTKGTVFVDDDDPSKYTRVVPWDESKPPPTTTALEETKEPSRLQKEVETTSQQHVLLKQKDSQSAEESSISRSNFSFSQVSTKFNDIIGHGNVKLRADEILLPLGLPPSVRESVLRGVRSQPASILLYGPPGCGKTQLAQAIAGESMAAFISIGPSDILSKFFGESERSIKSLFKYAREVACRMESRCTVLFFDEIDALGQSRDEGSGATTGGGGCNRRILAELLLQLTNLSQFNGFTNDSDSYDSDDSDSLAASETNDRGRVLVVAATNRPQDCDPALLRRFAVRVKVGLPSARDRRKILRKILNEFNHNISGVQLNELVGNTEGWSGSDLKSCGREAVMTPVRECLRRAAATRRKQRKQEQRDGDKACEEAANVSKNEGAHDVRNQLLNGLKSLRPVTLNDFQQAISFWLGRSHDGDDPIVPSDHYGSSSESEDDKLE